MAFIAVLVLVAMGAGSPPLTPQDRLWLASVDFTITKDERKQYESLDEAERRGFQEAFWRSRDPRPDTPQNEALEEYVDRLQFVEHYFQENEVPGVFTERGRMYMRFGKPAYRKIADMPARAGGSMSGSRRAWADGDVPVEIWVYDSSAGLEARKIPRDHVRGREQDQPLRPAQRRTQATPGRPQAVTPLRWHTAHGTRHREPAQADLTYNPRCLVVG